MPIWTHIAGVVRFDGIAGLMPTPDLNQAIPTGSEGPLEVHLHTNPEPSCLARWVGTIWGDLRDYEDEAEIVAYFNRIVRGQMIRQGCFSIHIEGSAPKQYIHDEDTNTFQLSDG